MEIALILIIVPIIFVYFIFWFIKKDEKDEKETDIKEKNMKTDSTEIIDLQFDKISNWLTFKIQRSHHEPKIVKYVQRHYERIPIYEGYYTRTKIIKKFNQIINPIKFVNEDILKLNLDKEFVIKIIAEIGIIPSWRIKEIKIADIEENITNLNAKMREFDKEKNHYQYKKIDYLEIPSNFWKCLLLIPFTLGFSFTGYNSKKQAQLNVEQNKENKVWNEQHKKEIDLSNNKLEQEIKDNNQENSKLIKVCYQELESVKAEEIRFIKEYEEGWLDLKNASNMHYPELANKKGVYIIWNKTKNKYYVGQSKNLKTRLIQHFKDGEPNNITFAKDYYDKDFFVYKYYICQTKDELDSLEKKYIEEYFAFETGYNKTSGNK